MLVNMVAHGFLRWVWELIYFLPWSMALSPLEIMSPWGGCIQVRSSSIPPSPVSEICGVFNNRDFQMVGGNQGNGNSLWWFSFLDSLEQLKRLFLRHSTGDLWDILWFFGETLLSHIITSLSLHIHMHKHTNIHIHKHTHTCRHTHYIIYDKHKRMIRCGFYKCH